MSDLRFDALGLATVAGTVLLGVTASLHTRRVAVLPAIVRAVSILVVLAGVVTRHRGEGTVALTLIVAAVVGAEIVIGAVARIGWRPIGALVVGAGAVIAAGFVDGDTSSVLAVVGAGAVLFVALSTRAVGVYALPAVLVVVAHHIAAEHIAASPISNGIDRAGLVAAVLGVAIVVAPGRILHSERIDVVWAGPRLATIGFAIAFVAVAQQTPEIRSAGLLVAGGATLAVASRHHLGLAALIPGAAAAVESLGAADHPVHAVAGVAAVTMILIAVAPGRSDSGGDRVQLDVRRHWPVALALVFAAVPLWGWSGADVAVGYNPAVATAVAAAGIVGVVSFDRLRRAAPASSVRATRR